jgi:hypothetical protein
MLASNACIFVVNTDVRSENFSTPRVTPQHAKLVILERRLDANGRVRRPSSIFQGISISLSQGVRNDMYGWGAR